MDKQCEELSQRLDGLDATIKELMEGMKILVASSDHMKNNFHGYGGGGEELNIEDKMNMFFKKTIKFLHRICDPFSCFKFTTHPLDTRRGLVHHHIPQRNIEDPMAQVVEVLAKDENGVDSSNKIMKNEEEDTDYDVSSSDHIITQLPVSKDKVDQACVNSSQVVMSSMSFESRSEDVVDKNVVEDMNDSFDYENVMERYKKLQHFDTLSDHSNHYYSKHTSSVKIESRPKAWHKRIKKEWKDLKKEYPGEVILVRAYEQRKDLLTAVIVGPSETPYHDGLFFFDVCFPKAYPDTTPLVWYDSRGHFINPNLKASGDNFEDFVIGYFRYRANDILKACEAYSDGVQVGCFVNGVPTEDNKGTFSITFDDELDSCIKPLIVEFQRIGVKVDESFIPS
ncbi:hypothetical protein QVD17_20365 [Tagetes erecta]|uniref:UBC core domain-containing protein n=1 Tax=Tagetes erecta TaxID=13708 RepID=A0AAD8KRI9_TARER|nr:hypothetical protein QVD17_20365 [Tagetes erecta]